LTKKKKKRWSTTLLSHLLYGNDVTLLTHRLGCDLDNIVHENARRDFCFEVGGGQRIT
jgi:hypothetical protein